MPQPKASSGHKLIFTEDESILLTDKNGNVIKLDTQGKNIEFEEFYFVDENTFFIRL